MRKKITFIVILLLGVLSGILEMGNYCDVILGRWFTKGRTQAVLSNYRVEVDGGIITEAKSGGVSIRASALGLTVRLHKRSILLGEPLMMDLENLPTGFKVSFEGTSPKLVYKGDTALTILLPARAGEMKVSIYPSMYLDSFTFWVCGDNRKRTDLVKDLLKKAKKWRPLFIAETGDLVGHGFSWEYKRFLKVIEDSPVPFFLVPGNHDLEFCGRRYFTRFLAPDHYYFTYGRSIFVILDNNHGEEGQVEWLDRILSNPFYLHKFVFAHKPPFDPRPGYEHCMERKEFVKRLLEILSKHKVDILFCSHIHSYLELKYRGVKIIITGGMGAHRKEPIKPFHYVEVKVGPEEVKTQMVPLITSR